MCNKSELLFEEAKKYIPGGVNSPVRAFKAVGGTPPFITSALGSKIYDVDGKEYIDYVSSWGPMIVGHRHPQVIKALQKALTKGLSYGAPTEAEIELARMIVEAVPSIEMVRMVNSGTEATMSAIRLARGYTGRDKIIKFSGCYHGHGDFLLVKAGSGATTLGIPDSKGVPDDFARNTITLPFNNLDAVRKAVKAEASKIAAIIVEPVPGNMGVVLPQEGFLRGLRDLCHETGIVLIFDEVMSGFRVAWGGAQSLYGVIPDMTCLGKVIGGGLPVGAFGGKKEIMENLAPLGPVYQAGTLSGNPLAVTAGLETLKILAQPGTYETLGKSADYLVEKAKKLAQKTGVKTHISRVGSMFTLFFASQEVIDYDTALKSDTVAFSRYFHLMLKGGIYLAPSQFEANFISLAHSQENLNKTLEVMAKAFKEL
ncbi:MAG TPA: glutamate-1-semialdehyde 2,1-aminomutase [Thermodesulfobacteriota bacterium]|nr:glutamate-1-semialdehyde 2,1-aminomutase [Thermodesulfobacteriota bacterium]